MSRRLHDAPGDRNGGQPSLSSFSDDDTATSADTDSDADTGIDTDHSGWGCHPSEVVATTYEATLHGPLFYASRGGSVIQTDTTVAATALMHALGYDYRGLGKQHVLVGEATGTPTYERLVELPLFTSEMEPIAADADERTFRTVSYATERAVTTTGKSNSGDAEFLHGSSKAFPRSKDGENAGWHRVREYRGLAPGSTFRFTVWTPPSETLPETVRFNAGIKRTGAISATAQATPAQTVSLNHFLLSSVYDIDQGLVSELTREGRFERGTDPRTTRFRDVPTDLITKTVIPQVVNTTVGD